MCLLLQVLQPVRVFDPPIRIGTFDFGGMSRNVERISTYSYKLLSSVAKRRGNICA